MPTIKVCSLCKNGIYDGGVGEPPDKPKQWFHNECYTCIIEHVPDRADGDSSGSSVVENSTNDPDYNPDREESDDEAADDNVAGTSSREPSYRMFMRFIKVTSSKGKHPTAECLKCHSTWTCFQKDRAENHVLQLCKFITKEERSSFSVREGVKADSYQAIMTAMMEDHYVRHTVCGTFQPCRLYT